ncbi:MAG: epoxyqueuosine reductase, partial [Thermoleophilia bacterium]|nr:epoxyqueuosine reductase [Thermoleophilia bacterium]
MATMLTESEFTATVIEKARSLGASVAGVADVEPLKASPSHRIYPKIGMDPEVRWQDAPHEALHHEVDWPADAVAAVVIGVAHPADQPELDWYDGKGTPGNRILIRIVKELSEWLAETYSVKSSRPPYFISSTGIFLKDAAVMAGLGRLGRNNLVVTPEYGPRIRWR